MRILLLVLLALVTTPSLAKDKEGKWMQGGGVGGVTCPSFNEAMRQARKHRSDSLEFAKLTQGFVMYISGFESGYNQAAPNTYDIFPSLTSDQTLSWTDHYCTEHLLVTFGDAVAALAAEMHPKRQVSDQP